jgi:hypothetical protein
MTQIQWFRDLKPFLCNSTKGQCQSKKNLSLFFLQLNFTSGDVR